MTHCRGNEGEKKENILSIQFKDAEREIDNRERKEKKDEAPLFNRQNEFISFKFGRGGGEKHCKNMHASKKTLARQN